MFLIVSYSEVLKPPKLSYLDEIQVPLFSQTLDVRSKN